MVNFLTRRLQVFVSSTYEDLKAERQAAVTAILTAGHIPAGMELFTSGDETQMEVIKQWIDESDVYLLILGGRYGSVEPNTGKSYTHLEYEYAVEKNKPLFACVVNEAALDQRIKEVGRSVFETENPQKLKDFRTFVGSKMVRFWDDAKDIKITVGETLPHFSRREDLIGWVRADQQTAHPKVTEALARLSEENAALRTQVQASKSGLMIGGLTFPMVKETLKNRGYLEEIYKWRRAFQGQFGNIEIVFNDDVTFTNELIGDLMLFGLAKYAGVSSSGASAWELTDDGRKFLARLDIEGIDSEEAEQGQ